MSIICCIFVLEKKRNTIMAYTIHNPRTWEHMEKESCYNHNYYRNPQTYEIILEECDEFNSCCSFYCVGENFKRGKYLGDCYCEDYDWDQEEDIELEYYS